MKHTLHALLCLLLVGFAFPAIAQYSQNFNSLPTAQGAWTDNGTLPGWYWITEDVAFVRDIRVGTGSANAGGLYAFATTGAPTDIALGSLGSGGPDAQAYGIILVNSGASAVVNPVIIFDGEQYRNGSNTSADTLVASYGVFGSVPTFTATETQTGFAQNTALNFVGPISTSATATALDGNDAANRVDEITVTLTGVTVNPGQYLAIKWFEKNDAGNDHALAIDDFRITSGTWSAPTASLPTVSFGAAFGQVNENGTNVTIPVTISAAPSADVTFSLVSADPGFTWAEGFNSDATLTPSAGAFTFTPTGPLTQNLVITPTNDAVVEKSQVELYRIVTVSGPATVGAADSLYVFIHDDDGPVPAPSNELSLSLLGSYTNNTVTGGGGIFSAEISAFDPATDRLFVANISANVVNVLSLATPSSITSLGSIPATGVNSVAVNRGIVAVAKEAAVKTDPGTVSFYRASDLTLLDDVTVGALPDMVTFTPDGSKLLVANEGEPSSYPSTVSTDPVGSVTIITVPATFPATPSDIAAGSIQTAGFTSFNGTESTARTSGIRITGDGASYAQDMEPEYITVTADGATAYVSLQENNAIATINIATATVTAVNALGTKDHSLAANSFDASDNGTSVLFGTWPVKGFYMPDGIDYANIGGTGYVFTANEGDVREYTGVASDGAEDERISGLTLDATAFPPAISTLLKTNTALGRLNATEYSGDTGSDLDYEELFIFGGRSFSIRNASTGALVWDSGNQLEKITANDATYGGIFNASNSGNNTLKNRSDDKGPEPEGIVVRKVNDVWYAFVVLERIGGIAVYNVNTPSSPIFVRWVNNRGAVVGAAPTGDRGPEGILYIRAEDSPNGTALLVASNEISGTVAVYSIDGVTPNDQPQQPNVALGGVTVSPNPASEYLYLKGAVEGNQPISVDLFNLNGARQISQSVRPSGDGQVDSSVYVGSLAPGLYVVTLQQGGKATSLRIIKN